MVSIVIPVYNVKPYLERCVKSVLHQSYQDYEIILIDDGSTDESGALCDDLCRHDSRIKVIHQSNQGLSGARNTGIREAKGEYIVFFDSDDEWLLSDGLEQLVAETPRDIVVFKQVDIWNGKYCPAADYDADQLNILGDAQQVFRQLVLTQRFKMSACFLMVRKQLLLDNDIFFPLGFTSEDIMWSLKLWQYARSVKVTNLNFYGYFHREASISSTVSVRVDQSFNQIFTIWKEHSQKGCVNADVIMGYLATMWVSRGYNYFKHNEEDKKTVYGILDTHADLLDSAMTPKAKRVARIHKCLGTRTTLFLLGIYWRIRTLIVR